MADATKNDGGPAFPVCFGQDGPLAQKFLARIDAGDWAADRCWTWMGARTTRGYGIFAPSKKVQFRAHRFAMKLYLGRPPRQMVLHRCDNPACVNPMHLEEGDHGENMRQMAQRKRAAREERHHKAKLTFEEAAAISLLHRSGDYSTRELAKMFAISQPTSAAIISGRLWPDAYAIADAMIAERSK